MSTIEVLKNQLYKTPWDWELRLVFSDALEEAGMGKEAKKQRKLAEMSRSKNAHLVHTIGPWITIQKVKNCLCSDGVRRTAYTGTPDTYFTIPARVTIKGKTVSGFVTQCNDGDYQFIAYKPGKNSYLLPYGD